MCPHAVRSESRQPSNSSHSQCSSREHAGAVNPSLSPNFLPEAGSCAGGLSAVKQRVKHAGTELALQVSAAWHCFPMNVGNVNVLKETKAGFDAKLEVINSVFKKPQPVKILPPG